MTEWGDFTTSEQDSLRAGLAILRAGNCGDFDAFDVIVNTCNVNETMQALTGLALTFAELAGVDIERYTATAFADINNQDAA